MMKFMQIHQDGEDGDYKVQSVVFQATLFKKDKQTMRT